MSSRSRTLSRSRTGRRARLFLWTSVVLVALALVSCESEAEKRMTWTRDAKAVEGDVVAVVNGEKIPAQVLRNAVAREPDRSVRQHLDDLISGTLLYREAELEGFATGPEMDVLRKQLMVQRMLEEHIEKKITPENLDEKEVRAYYDKGKSMYYNPELRVADHLLVMPNPKQWDTSAGETAPPEIVALCDEYSAKIRADLDARGITAIGSAELMDIKQQWEPKVPETLALHVDLGIRTAKRAVGTPGTGLYYPAVVEEFADEAFRLDVGVISQPTRSQFGTHIIVVRQIIPEDTTSYEMAAKGIRDLLVREKRQELMKNLLEDLQSRSDAMVDTQAVAKLGEQKQPDEGAKP